MSFRELREKAKGDRDRAIERARGGSAKHDDEAQDRALVKTMLRKEEKDEKRGVEGKKPATRLDRAARKRGGACRADGGRTSDNADSPDGDRDLGDGTAMHEGTMRPLKYMRETTPPDDAKVQVRKRGGEAEKRAHGGKTGKKHPQVNIMIAPQGQDRPVPVPVKQPVPVPVPAGAGGAGMPPRPPVAGMGPPPGGLPPGAGAGGPPPGMMPHRRGGTVQRAKGGKVPMTMGAHSGLGRMEKKEEAEGDIAAKMRRRG